jgi:hypothetical protein
MASILSRKSILSLAVGTKALMKPFMALAVLLTLMGVLTSKEAYAGSLSVGGGTLSWSQSTSVSNPCDEPGKEVGGTSVTTTTYTSFFFTSAASVITTFPGAMATQVTTSDCIADKATPVSTPPNMSLVAPAFIINFNVYNNTATICTVSAWPTASALTYGQTLASSKLTGGTASVAGTFAWTTPTTDPPTGTQAESITFTPTPTSEVDLISGETLTVNYGPIAASANVMVNQASQTITFPAPASPELPSASPLTLSATSSSGLPVTYTITSVAANQPGNAYYLAAPQVTQSFVVQKATPSVSVSCSPNPLTYGASNNTTCTATVSGGATGTIAWTANKYGWTTTTLSGGSTSVVGWGGRMPGPKP